MWFIQVVLFCFVFNRRKLEALWREKYLQKFCSSRSVSARTSPDLWNMKQLQVCSHSSCCYFSCMTFQLLVCCVPLWGQTIPNHRWKLHPGPAPGGLEPPNLFSLSFLSPLPPQATWQGWWLTPLLAQLEVLCLILKPSKPFQFPHPCTWLSSNPQSSFHGVFLQKLAESWGWAAIPIISEKLFYAAACLCCSLHCTQGYLCLWL